MQITDAIADMLTRIRNAGTAGHATVDVPQSNMSTGLIDGAQVPSSEVPVPSRFAG